MILFEIQGEALGLVNHFGDVVCLALVVKDGIALDGEVGRLPGVCVVQRWCDDIDPEDEGCEDVEDGPSRNHERRASICNLGP